MYKIFVELYMYIYIYIYIYSHLADAFIQNEYIEKRNLVLDLQEKLSVRA